MNEGLKKFQELLMTDEKFQAKLMEAVSACQGEPTEEEIFNTVLTPLAAEYGISATYDEFKEYMDSLNNREINSDEVAQIAGGTSKGFGLEATACIGIGFGAGAGAGKEGGGVCVIWGVGWGSNFCAGEGESACFATGEPHGY